MNIRLLLWFAALLGIFVSLALAGEIHVAVTGDDGAKGDAAHPLRTIQAAAMRAMPGDTVTVHEGVYRERIDPPRGGESDAKRIIYQAAAGERVVIKGSELVKGWEKMEHDTWRVVLPNSFFGDFNPFADPIRGDWFQPQGRVHHTGAVYLNGHWLMEAAGHPNELMKPAGAQPLWSAQVDGSQTRIWAQFPSVNPNEASVEINVRKAVFYPGRTGCNYITVRGFILEHAATNWAPPTAEQVGLIGTHWSKGWVIENNTIRYSTCTGVALGKHGDKYDNTSADSAEGYVETIKRGLAAGWSRENIGHHLVRNNHISHCEQAGIVGSLGAAFSTITSNEIHDIHVRQLFGGAEQAGIKIHAAVDTLIAGNHIHHCNRGMWLDWMAQGTRVRGNLFHDNSADEDLFVEVNHGPFLVDHNIFLSPRVLADWSQGGAYAHNLFAGKLVPRPELRRETPWLEEHGTQIAGLKNIPGGDSRFFNNLLIAPAGLDAYDASATPNPMAGNLFLAGAKPSRQEAAAEVLADFHPGITLRQDKGVWHLELKAAWVAGGARSLVTTERLGKTAVSGLPFVNPDGSPLRVDRDYHNRPLPSDQMLPGPFQSLVKGQTSIPIWPIVGGD